MNKKKRGKKLDYRHDKCKFCGGVKLKNSPMCRPCFNKKKKNSSKPKLKKEKPAKIKYSKEKHSWFIQQKKDAQRIFNPKVDYNNEYDILYITWLPQTKCKYSLETESDFIFDLTEKDYIKGVEIMNFKKRFLKDVKPKPKSKSNKKKRR